MDFKTLSALLRHGWFINKQYADEQMPFVLKLIQGTAKIEPAKSWEDEPLTKEEKKQMAEDAKIVMAGVPTIDMNWFNWVKKYSEEGIAPGSIALIDVDGPMFKNDYCGDAGMLTMAKWVQMANDEPNISAILFTIDSPGGMVDGSSTLGDAVRSSEKPVWSFVRDGMCCSAAYMLASNCQKVFSSHSKNTIGSIGVYTSFWDFSQYYEKEGIRKIEVYAPESTEKNLAYKEALKGNVELIERDLSEHAQSFISGVKNQRKINLSVADPFKGATYFSNVALEMGLIDGISTYQEVLQSLQTHATKSNTNSHNTMFGNKFKALAAAKGKETLSAEEISAISQEMTAEGITAIEIHPAGVEMATMEEFNAANLTIENQTTEINQLKAERDQWKKKAEDLGAKPIESTEDPIPGKDNLPSSKKKEVHPWDVERNNAIERRERRSKAFGANKAD